jgi:hypothetical protein
VLANYRFGHVEVDGQEHRSDVMVHRDWVESWWRVTGHRVAPEDLVALAGRNPGIVVIGTGAFGLMRVPDAARKFLEDKGVTVHVARTADAVTQFNDLLARGENVAIAMHLTC